MKPKKYLLFNILILIIFILLFNCTLSQMGNESDDEPKEYSFSINVIGSGTVSPLTGSYLEGKSVTLDAIPDTGYVFVGWIGDLSGNENPKTFKINSNKKITAVFNLPGTSTVMGTVVDSVAGSAVEGSTVLIAGLSTTTDPNGEFILTDVPVGTHDLLVTKDGRANSMLQEIDIEENNVKQVEIIQQKYAFESNASAICPRIVLAEEIEVFNFTDGEEVQLQKHAVYSGKIYYGLQAEVGTYPIEANGVHGTMMISYGGVTGYPEFTSYLKIGGDRVTSVSILPAYDLPPGELNIKFVIYDINNNRTELNVPVIIESSSGSGPSDLEDTDYEVCALTYGESKNYFSPRLSEGISLEKSAPVDSSALVEFYIAVKNNTKGICVYRSTSKKGVYKLAGKTMGRSNYYDENNVLIERYLFKDCSSEITPGENIYYKIAYFNENGEGDKTGSIKVRILPKYNLYINSPIDNSVIDDISPSFYWSSDRIENANRFDYIRLLDVTNGYLIKIHNTFLINQTEYHHNWNLQYNKLYQWDIISEYQVKEGNVLSISYPSKFNSSINGGFYFTVAR